MGPPKPNLLVGTVKFYSTYRAEHIKVMKSQVIKVDAKHGWSRLHKTDLWLSHRSLF